MPDEKKVDWDKFHAFMAVTSPGNEAHNADEYSRIIRYWDEREPQTGMPRGILLDDQVIQEIPPMHKIVLGAVQVNTSKDAGQVFPLEFGTLGLGAPVYLAIAAAGGISFPDESSSLDMAASRFPDRVVAKVGSLRTDLAGQVQFKTGLYILDIETKCENLRVKLAAETNDAGKPKWTPEQIDVKVAKLRQNLRESSAQRAITGAQRAAVKAHYGKLRRKWYEEDFNLPLLVPRLVTDMKALLDTQEGRMMFAMQATGLAKVLAFGGGRSPLAGLLGTTVSATPAALPAGPADAPFVDDEDEEPVFPEAKRAPEPTTATAPEPSSATSPTAAATSAPVADPAAAAAKPPADQASQGGQSQKPDKAQEWRAVFAAATEAGYTQAQKAEIQDKARAAAVAAGAMKDASSDTWSPEQWKAARECFKPAGAGAVLPEEEPDRPVDTQVKPIEIRIPATPEAFSALDEKGQVTVLEELLRTRVLAKPPQKGPAELSPTMRVTWFDTLRVCPVKTTREAA